ncbi:MAG: site-specific integrase [Pseudomonadota bacterium]
MAQRDKIRLSKRAVEALAPAARLYAVWDAEIPGFGLRVFPSGVQTYFLQYRSPRKRTTQKKKIGRHGQVTAEEARRIARELLGRIAMGSDPASELAADRAAPTVDQLWARWRDQHVRLKLKPRTQEEYERSYRRNVGPAIGRMKVKDVSLEDVNKILVGLGEKWAQSNRTRALIFTLFEFADRHDFRPDGRNPAKHALRFKEKRRERVLSEAEERRLLKALEEAETDESVSPFAVAAFRLLYLRGMRLGEVRTLKWEYVNGDVLELPDSKTGAKRVFVDAKFLKVLHAIPRDPGNPFVIQGDVSGQPIINLQKCWRRVRLRADLPDLRIHDLRHNYATKIANGGLPLQLAQEQLGHKDIQTTMRYVHVSDDARRRAAQTAAAQMIDVTDGVSARPRLRVVE